MKTPKIPSDISDALRNGIEVAYFHARRIADEFENRPVMVQFPKRFVVGRIVGIAPCGGIFIDGADQRHYIVTADRFHLLRAS